MIKYNLISDVISGVGGVETLEIGACKKAGSRKLQPKVGGWRYIKISPLYRFIVSNLQPLEIFSVVFVLQNGG